MLKIECQREIVREMMRLAVLLLIAVAALQAQEAQKTGTVEGSVVNSVTGAGIAGVTGMLMSTPPGHRYEIETDSKGTFRITSVEPGAYHATVRKDGFGPARANSYFLGGSPIQVKPADIVRVSFELMPPGAIRGRVIGLDGNPAAKVEVVLGPTETATKTADDGTFAFENVPAGQHGLLARVGNVPTYFPAAVDPALAEPIQVAPGADQSGYEIRLQSAVVHRVRGIVLDAAGKPAPKPLIRLFPAVQDSDAFAFLLSTAGTTMFSINSRSSGVRAAKEDPMIGGEDGSFELPAVREGNWVLHAEVDNLHQNMPLSVRQDIDDVRVRLEPEFEIHGRVALSDGSAAPGDPIVMVRLISADGVPGASGSAVSVKNGLLSIGALTPGRYRVQATVVGGAYYVTSVIAGTVDAMDQPVLLGPATGEIRVVLKAGSVIRGTVEKCDGASVLLVPQSLTVGDVGRLHLCTNGGDFEFDGLPPGDYYALAMSKFDLQSLALVEQLRAMMRDATEVRVEDGGTANVQLELR